MATKKRLTVAERERQAINAQAPAPLAPATKQAPSPALTEPAPSTTSTPETAAPAPTQPSAEGTVPQRLGVYINTSTFGAARAAYLADWLAGGEADTFAKWVAEAVHAYASWTPQHRTDFAAALESPTKGGRPKSFTVPEDTISALTAGRVADQSEGRWLSQSEWAGEAIAAAIARARARDGELPTPPARLPHRLVR